MLKNILKLAGVAELSKNEQKQIKGGGCNPEETCCYICHCGVTNRYIYPGGACYDPNVPCDVHEACV